MHLQLERSILSQNILNIKIKYDLFKKNYLCTEKNNFLYKLYSTNNGRIDKSRGSTLDNASIEVIAIFLLDKENLKYDRWFCSLAE